MANFISKVKASLQKVWTSICGTPVTATGSMSTDISIPHSMTMGREIGTPVSKTLSRPIVNWRKVWRYIHLVIKLIARIFVGAIAFTVLAHFVPELREELPSLYRLVDCLMVGLEWLYAKFWHFIGIFL